MSYSRRETKILTDYHRRHGRTVNACYGCGETIREGNYCAACKYIIAGSDPNDPGECRECGGEIPYGVVCDACRYRDDSDEDYRDPYYDLPDNLDDYCDDCGYFPCQCEPSTLDKFREYVRLIEDGEWCGTERVQELKRSILKDFETTDTTH